MLFSSIVEVFELGNWARVQHAWCRVWPLLVYHQLKCTTGELYLSCRRPAENMGLIADQSNYVDSKGLIIRSKGLRFVVKKVLVY